MMKVSKKALRARAAVLVAACALALGCAGRKGLAPAPDRELDELILLLADRKLYEPFTVTSALTAGEDVRVRLADALGRTGAAEAVTPLVALLADESLEVRRRAAFGLGVLGHAEAAVALRRAGLDRDRELAVLAVEALAKLGEPLADVVALLAPLPPEEMWARLAPSLFRFQGEAILEHAVNGFGVIDVAVRRQLIYALARDPLARALPILRTFVDDTDPVVRAWIARALGLTGSRQDVETLLLLLDDTDAVAIQAAGALRSLAESGRPGTAADSGWVAPWLAVAARDHPGPRAAALAAVSVWPPAETIDRRIYALSTSGSIQELELGLVALARRAPGRGTGPLADSFEELLASAIGHETPGVRAAAVRAAAIVGRTETVQELAFDPAPGVRMAVHEILLSGAPDESAAAAVWILRDPDDAVRAATLEWLAEQPRLPVEVLALALDGYTLDQPGELVVDLVRAITARAAAEPLERGLGIEILERLSNSSRYVVRRVVAAGLTELGVEPPAVGPAARDRPRDFYRAVAAQGKERRQIEFETARGSFRVELDCVAAPITCSSFLQLVRQGFYDGLAFHRVVPDYVVQTGDPRGDGWGGPGFDLRAEVTRLRFERGVLGMADSGLDTAGSQIFLTLAPLPHLDGRYTAFGRTVTGIEILDEIERGDRIRAVREVE